MTGRWKAVSGRVDQQRSMKSTSDRTRPVVKYRFWNLTRNDRTLEAERLVSLCAVSGQVMTVEI